MSVFKLLYVQNIHFDKSMLFLFFYFLFGGFLFEDNVLSFFGSYCIPYMAVYAKGTWR